MRVRFLDQAKADLIAHDEHYHKIGGAVLARRMLALLKKPMFALRDHPEIAPPYEMAPGVRRLVVARGAYLVFYRVMADIEVIHIRRAEREPVGIPELIRHRPNRQLVTQTQGQKTD